MSQLHCLTMSQLLSGHHDLALALIQLCVLQCIKVAGDWVEWEGGGNRSLSVRPTAE